MSSDSTIRVALPLIFADGAGQGAWRRLCSELVRLRVFPLTADGPLGFLIPDTADTRSLIAEAVERGGCSVVAG